MRKLIRRAVWYPAIGFAPTPEQLEPCITDAQTRVFCAGRRTGKTTCWAHEDSRVLASPGGHRVAIFGPSHELVERAWRVVASDLWRSKDPAIRAAFRPVAKNDAPGLRHVELPNGAHLSGFSTERPDKSALGDGYDLVHVTEAARVPERVWDEYILPSIMDTGGAALLDSTPRGEDWFARLYRDGQDGRNGIRSWRLPSWANTVAFPGGRQDPKILRAEARMTRDAWLQEIEASFVTFRGRVWPEFSRETHGFRGEFGERPAIVFGAIDWGWTHPAALVVGGYTGSGRLVVLWSWEGSETRIPRLMQIAAEASAEFGVRGWYAGHDRPENIEEFRRAGIPCDRAVNARSDGFDCVGSLMLPQDDGRPGFVVSLDRAEPVASACERVRWRDGIRGGDRETEPDGADSADALRYLAMSTRGARDRTGMSLDWL